MLPLSKGQGEVTDWAGVIWKMPTIDKLSPLFTPEPQLRHRPRVVRSALGQAGRSGEQLSWRTAVIVRSVGGTVVGLGAWAVWDAAFLLEAALRVVIVYNTSAGTALVISKATPFVFFAVLSAWTVAYGAHHRKKGERMAAAAGEAAEARHVQ
jgi:hypothetical protein